MKTLALLLATMFPLDPALWLLDPQQPDAGVVFTKHGALAFNFPTVDTGAYTGNLYLPWAGPLDGTLIAAIQVVTFPVGDKPVRFIPAPNGDCISPARVYLYFQTGPLYDSTEGTRWWAVLDSWPLGDTGGATVVLSASLEDPSRWYSVYGHPATDVPGFENAKAHPTYVGLTFGGNCTNGHGVATGKGTAQFRLLSYALQ